MNINNNKQQQQKDEKQLLFARNKSISLRKGSINNRNLELEGDEVDIILPGDVDGILLPISNCHSEAITTSIQIGTDKTQRFDVVIDTTSINTWVPSSKCETCEFFNTYDYDESAEGDSNNYKAFAPTINVNQGLEIVGDKVHNDIHLGSKTINGYEFGAISSFPDEFYPICGSVDGIIGLGKGDDNILGHLIKDLPNPVISLYLNAESDDYMLDIQNRKLLQSRQLIRSAPTDNNKDEDVYFDDDDDNDDDDDEDEDDDNYDDDEDDYDDDNDEDDDEDDDNYDDDNMMDPMQDETDPTTDETDPITDEAIDSNYEYGDYMDEEDELPEYEEEGILDDMKQQDEEYVDDYGTVDDVYDVGGGEEYTPRPKFARSELVLGGVNPKHYQGCLTWHTAVNNDNTWSMMVDFGDENNNTPTIASLSTITDIVYGPSSIIGDYLNANKAKCYDLVQSNVELEQNDAYIEEQDQEQNDSLGEEKDCKTDAFDVAFYDCSKDSIGDKFIPFEFESETGQGGNTKQEYSLGFDELIEQYVQDDQGGKEDIVCAFRMKAFEDNENDQLVLGTPMFEKYYVSFNIEANIIGLAPSRTSLDDFCDVDSSLFVSKLYQTTGSTSSSSGGAISDEQPASEMTQSVNNGNAGAAAEEGSNIDFSLSSMKDYAEENNKVLVVIPIMIVVVFIIGLIIKRKRNNSYNGNADATRSTPGAGVNYDFVDPSCREYVSNNAISGGAADDGEWEGYDDRQFT